MSKMSTLIIIKDTEPINTLCFRQEDVAIWLANYDGTCVVPDPEDDFGTEFITLTKCIAVDVTGLDPMPGVGTGWSYVKGKWVGPVVPEPELIDTDEA
jgi:hypothetical protein